jgi:hypothetical protein
VNAALIQVTLLDLANALKVRGLTVTVNHRKGEVRAANEDSGLGQWLGVREQDGEIVIGWLWDVPPSVPETLGELRERDQALLEQIREDRVGADPQRGPAQPTPPPTPEREFQPIGIAWTRVETIAKRVGAVLKPAEARTP